MATYETYQPLDLSCDVVVIGSGAGGAVIADQLSAAGLDVVIVEEGPFRPAAKIPPKTTQSFLDMWRASGVTAALGKHPVAYAEGACVGGGTEINSAIFQQTPDDLLDTWGREREIDDFSATSLQPYYDRAAATVNASYTTEPLGPASDLLKTGAEALNWEVKALKRGQKGCVGTNLCSFGCPTSGKQSMTATLIPAALKRGARLIARCRISKLDIRNGQVNRIRGTATNARGERHKITIRPRHVFVCAGAIHTPALLRRSGLKGRIGNTLRMHPTLKVMATFDDTVNATNTRLPLYAVTEFMPDLRLGGSVTTPGVFGMAVAEDWRSRAHFLDAPAKVASYYAMIRASSTGTVTPLPGAREPLVRYTLNLADLAQLKIGLQRLAEVTFAAGARHVVPSLRGHGGWHSLDDMKREAAAGFSLAKANLMTIHLFSSCALGDDAFGPSPVDAFGAVKGVSNLHVADASLIPEAPGANPQGTVMALAYRTADHFLATQP